jgi:penicillin amidase
MKLDSREMLRRLGAGESIDAVCQAAGITQTQFDGWWRAQTAARVPPAEGSSPAAVRAEVRVVRDARGIPHIDASNDPDLFFGFGYAMAQDRLFQLDYLRRKGAGRLCEILGHAALEQDQLVRTVGIRRIAEEELTRLPLETRTVLDAFAAGINAWIAHASDRLPIEFDLLDYRPEPWMPADSLTIEGEFRWYLTGRMWVIAMPELAKRTLRDWPLYRLFLSRESDRESMLPGDSYARSRCGVQATSPAMGLSGARPAADARAGTAGAAARGSASDPRPEPPAGSNNWVVSGQRTASGRPLLASDPHIAFDAVSCWYEVHLRGGSYHVVGMAYVGMPAVMFGRTAGVAWGCTNNICSQRDLYQEKTDSAHPGCFLYDGRWEPAREIEEVIGVRGAEPVREVVRISRNGPIVDAVLPRAARHTGPVSLRWLGASEGGWLTALLAMDRAQSAAELREAMRTWHVPTFSVVSADTAGHIAYQATGRLPIRNVPERAYRPGWDPLHQWDGLIPFEGMPHCIDPPRGWLATANHRPAPDDFPYPLSGTWLDDLRARRIRERIEAAAGPLTRHDFAAMQLDCKSLRAVECLPKLLAVLDGVADDRVAAAARVLRAWDCQLLPDSPATAIFEAFFAKWLEAVTAARFSGAAAELLIMAIAGVATALLDDDPHGWFPAGTRVAHIERAFRAGLDLLTERLGPDMSGWSWGRLHTMPLRHWLSGRGELGRLLDHGGTPVRGDSTAVCNTGLAADFTAPAGCGYRLIADLASCPPELWAVDGQSQSGNPGSPHYRDQLDDWLTGRYHCLSLTDDAATEQRHQFVLVPTTG